MPPELTALLELLSREKRLLIVVHDNPDPDALAAARALAKLAESRGVDHWRICCEGIVGRAENRAMARELSLKPLPATHVNWKHWPNVALVDAQPGTGNNSLPRRIVPEIIIDHHPLMPGARAKFLDVRPEYGSCTTIITEYLTGAGVSIPPELAAGMCYAISTDTQDLARETCPADTEAYVRLYPLADKKILGRILHPRLRPAYYSTLARAILSAFTYGNIIGSHLGEIDHPDSVSLVADLLLQHERMGWCIVTGIQGDFMYVSLRGLPGRAHAGAMLRRVLGRKGRAGGHGTMAGGKLPLAGLDPEQRDKLQKDLVLKLIRILRRRDDVVLRPLIGPKELSEAFYKFI